MAAQSFQVHLKLSDRVPVEHFVGFNEGEITRLERGQHPLAYGLRGPSFRRMRCSHRTRAAGEMKLVVADAEDPSRRLTTVFASERHDEGGDPLGLEPPINLEALHVFRRF